MDVFLDNVITPSGFIKFEIGQKINLNCYKEGIDYNPVGLNDSSLGYYFFNSAIDFELYEKNGLINSFDILLKNQKNQLFIGQENSLNFNLNNCKLYELISYLNRSGLEWKFDKILSEKSLSIVFDLKLLFILYFDFDPHLPSELSLITLGRIPN